MTSQLLALAKPEILASAQADLFSQGDIETQQKVLADYLKQLGGEEEEEAVFSDDENGSAD
ncbi:hypothetical protein DACRYDRAFT_90898 [Dacryopinax primogenitus]|uniref:Uncharacterized protein n=1 Tax=Dacryopinax primogenitus (strain DJM 731) TaxID=1858805 RepID=M5FP85_DACPD|nr:uncharacterized protein DACRYDRAFT_90898 [Dacryopinax primogenitus]EJT98320.1 hypothetical protein DACRYDRAFT_90898 [Dacryopinax primogenitus]